MTNLNELTANVQRLTLALDATSADVAMLTRLRDAETLAGRLSVELSDAQDKLSQAMANKVIADRDAVYARFRTINVAVTPSVSSPSSVLSAAYTISVETKVYDGKANVSRWVVQTYGGFNALPSDALAYLMNVKPEALPASIMALAPDEPHKAMDVYLIGLRRGYLTQ